MPGSDSLNYMRGSWAGQLKAQIKGARQMHKTYTLNKLINNKPAILHFSTTLVTHKRIVTRDQIHLEAIRISDALKIEFCDEYEECGVI